MPTPVIIAIDEFAPPQRAGQEIELDLECLNSTWSAVITFDAWRQRELPDHNELLVVLSDDLESQAHEEAHRRVLLLDKKRRLGEAGVGELGKHHLHEHGSDASAAVRLEQRYEERWRLVVDVAAVVHYAREAAADDLAAGLGDQNAVVLAVAESVHVHPVSRVFDDAAGRLPHAVGDEDGFVEKAVEHASNRAGEFLGRKPLESPVQFVEITNLGLDDPKLPRLRRFLLPGHRELD